MSYLIGYAKVFHGVMCWGLFFSSFKGFYFGTQLIHMVHKPSIFFNQIRKIMPSL